MLTVSLLPVPTFVSGIRPSAPSLKRSVSPPFAALARRDLPRLLPIKRLDSLHPPTLLSRDVDGRSRQRRMSQVLLRNLNGHPTGNRMACMGVPYPMGTC